MYIRWCVYRCRYGAMYIDVEMPVYIYVCTEGVVGCWGLWVGVVPLFTGSYIHMNGQDTGHHSSPKFLSRLAPSATPWYTILAGRLNDARGVVSTLNYMADIYPR